jgi:hypothetical protein
LALLLISILPSAKFSILGKRRGPFTTSVYLKSFTLDESIEERKEKY